MLISFLNPQGNFDRHDSRWVTHPDFGGQLVYVKELAIAMARMGYRVDIVTRRISDPEWPEFSSEFDTYEGVENMRIVRLDFGPEKFLDKEELWAHLIPGYVEKLIEFYKKEGQMPDAVTAHYGDGGLAAACLKEKTGIPYTFTAHSLGAQKMDKLGVTSSNASQLDKRYNFSLRLLAERVSVNKADRIITSTRQERFSQYTHTAYQEAVFADNDEKFSVIPPGVSLRVFDKNIKPDPELAKEFSRLLKRDLSPNRVNLPSVISSSRLDPKKNIQGIVKAFGESHTLQDEANLVIVTRGFQNPLKQRKKLPKTREGAVLQELISLIDTYGLRGKVSMISIEKQERLAQFYRFLSDKRSVFCLAALYEPFGLAPLEAMACGLPAVVTKFGGPAESLREGDREFGILVDPNNPGELAGALHSLASSPSTWESYSIRGYQRVLERFTWEKTALSYMNVINEITSGKKEESLFDIKIHPYFLDPEKTDPPGPEALKELYLRLNILCAGETVIDFISKKKTNSLIDAEDFSRYLGGNPANVAVYASKLSKKVALLTKLGKGHFASFIEAELNKYGVNTEYIRYTDKDDTSVAFLSHTPTEPDFQSMHSADRKISIKDVTTEMVERADMVYTSLSSLVEEPSRSAVRKVLRIAKRTGKITALDPNFHPKIWTDREEGLEILAQICDGVTIVNPSLGDARHIFDYNMPEEELTELCINTFHNWGAGTVVMTAGGRYVLVAEYGKEVIKVEDLPPVDIVDSTGGGRAFMSGFLVGYHDSLPYSKCVLLGHHVASLALQSIGPFPRHISRKEIYEKILEM